MNRPLISICLPNLNGRAFLAERMETIFAQTMSVWELIVCDSYSDDGSWELFQKFKRDPRVRLYQVPREGLYAGWNECLRRACGEFVYIATADDTAAPDCLEKLMSPLEHFPEVDIAVCDFQDIDESSQPLMIAPRIQHIFLGEWMNIASIRNGKSEFLLHCAFGTTIWVTLASVMFRRSLLNRIGVFRTDRGSKADEEWTLRASLASDVAFVPGKLVSWRHHSRQATRLWDFREGRRIMHQCALSVLRDPSSGIPESWKTVPRWEKMLSLHHKHDYERTFKLYRWMARQDPKRFIRDARESLYSVPNWLLHQVLRAFRADDRDDFDDIGYARHLLERFGAEWPPRKITS